MFSCFSDNSIRISLRVRCKINEFYNLLITKISAFDWMIWRDHLAISLMLEWRYFLDGNFLLVLGVPSLNNHSVSSFSEKFDRLVPRANLINRNNICVRKYVSYETGIIMRTKHSHAHNFGRNIYFGNKEPGLQCNVLPCLKDKHLYPIQKDWYGYHPVAIFVKRKHKHVWRAHGRYGGLTQCLFKCRIRRKAFHWKMDSRYGF